MAIRAALLVLVGSCLAACSTTVKGSGGNTAGESGGAGGSPGDASGRIEAGESMLPTAGVSGTTDAGVGEVIDPSQCAAPTLKAVIRDFRGFATGGIGMRPRTSGAKHPDFEIDHDLGLMPGMVESTLGADQKPVLAAGVTNVTSAATFRQWYTDVDGVNMRFEIEIPLTPDPSRSGVFVYDNQEFFPIDNQGWGNQSNPHNQDFTTEIHLRFVYKAHQTFTFIGDDDLWLFINNKLAIDLGGVHDQQKGTVDLDAKAAELGIEPGKWYAMDIFHAERHVSESHFHMETTIECVVPVVIP